MNEDFAFLVSETNLIHVLKTWAFKHHLTLSHALLTQWLNNLNYMLIAVYLNINSLNLNYQAVFDVSQLNFLNLDLKKIRTTLYSFFNTDLLFKMLCHCQTNEMIFLDSSEFNEYAKIHHKLNEALNDVLVQNNLSHYDYTNNHYVLVYNLTSQTLRFLTYADWNVIWEQYPLVLKDILNKLNDFKK